MSYVINFCMNCTYKSHAHGYIAFENSHELEGVKQKEEFFCTSSIYNTYAFFLSLIHSKIICTILL